MKNRDEYIKVRPKKEKLHISRAMLDEMSRKKPDVGEALHIIPSHCDRDMTRRPQPCVVQFVSEKGRFFTVRFLETGLRESFSYGCR